MQDYAAKLRALPGSTTTASPTLGPGSAQALMGGYASFLPGAGQQPGGNGSGMQFGLADNAPVTDEQRSIIDTLMQVMNRAPRAR